MKLLAASTFACALLASGCATPHGTSPATPAPVAAPAAALPPPPVAPSPPHAAVPAASGLGVNETQVARYTTVTTQPQEADSNPLAVVAKVHFPRAVVTTVGDAVRYVLLRTGYQLVQDDALDAGVKAVFGLRLPDHQRALGPYRVDTMLGVLMGQPYQLIADPASRTVTYAAVSAKTAGAAPSTPSTPRGSAPSAAPLSNSPVVMRARE